MAPNDKPVINLLVLGGTREARRLCDALAERNDCQATLSLAGATRRPVPAPIATRRGGFGGVNGLVAYLRTESIDLVIDATHPFAATMSAHAGDAARIVGVPLWRLTRPAWGAEPGMRWHSVPDARTAAAALGDYGRRVFLTVGARSLAPFADVADKHWVIRSIEAPPATPVFSPASVIRARPPFTKADEYRLMQDYGVDVLVTKNSGAPMLETKLAAAHALNVPVVMIERPVLAAADRVFDAPGAVITALDAHQ